MAMESPGVQHVPTPAVALITRLLMTDADDINATVRKLSLALSLLAAVPVAAAALYHALRIPRLPDARSDEVPALATGAALLTLMAALFTSAFAYCAATKTAPARLLDGLYGGATVLQFGVMVTLPHLPVSVFAALHAVLLVLNRGPLVLPLTALSAVQLFLALYNDSARSAEGPGWSYSVTAPHRYEASTAERLGFQLAVCCTSFALVAVSLRGFGAETDRCGAARRGTVALAALVLERLACYDVTGAGRSLALILHSDPDPGGAADPSLVPAADEPRFEDAFGSFVEIASRESGPSRSGTPSSQPGRCPVAPVSDNGSFVAESLRSNNTGRVAGEESPQDRSLSSAMGRVVAARPLGPNPTPPRASVATQGPALSLSRSDSRVASSGPPLPTPAVPTALCPMANSLRSASQLSGPPSLSPDAMSLSQASAGQRDVPGALLQLSRSSRTSRASGTHRVPKAKAKTRAVSASVVQPRRSNNPLTVYSSSSSTMVTPRASPAPAVGSTSAEPSFAGDVSLGSQRPSSVGMPRFVATAASDRNSTADLALVARNAAYDARVARHVKALKHTGVAAFSPDVAAVAALLRALERWRPHIPDWVLAASRDDADEDDLSSITAARTEALPSGDLSGSLRPSLASTGDEAASSAPVPQTPPGDNPSVPVDAGSAVSGDPASASSLHAAHDAITVCYFSEARVLCAGAPIPAAPADPADPASNDPHHARPAQPIQEGDSAEGAAAAEGQTQLVTLVHRLAGELDGTVHGVAGDTITVTWGVVSVVQAPDALAVLFVWRLECLLEDHGLRHLCVGAAVSSGTGLVALAGSVRPTPITLAPWRAEAAAVTALARRHGAFLLDGATAAAVAQDFECTAVGFARVPKASWTLGCPASADSSPSLGGTDRTGSDYTLSSSHAAGRVRATSTSTRDVPTEQVLDAPTDLEGQHSPHITRGARDVPGGSSPASTWSTPTGARDLEGSLLAPVEDEPAPHALAAPDEPTPAADAPQGHTVVLALEVTADRRDTEDPGLAEDLRVACAERASMSSALTAAITACAHGDAAARPLLEEFTFVSQDLAAADLVALQEQGGSFAHRKGGRLTATAALLSRVLGLPDSTSRARLWQGLDAPDDEEPAPPALEDIGGFRCVFDVGQALAASPDGSGAVLGSASWDL